MSRPPEDGTSVRWTRQRPFLAILAVAVVLVLSALTRAHAVGRESKIFIYLIYNQKAPAQKTFAEALFKKFNLLGFVERMKKRGVSWVEANYDNAGSAASFLHIGSDEIIYFGVLMGDTNDRITREMYRAHVAVPPHADEKSVRRLADESAHRFYYEVANLIDTFNNPTAWKRQFSVVNPRSERAGGVKLILDGKDVSTNTALLPRRPFQRSNIHVVMVPFSPAFFKRLGADDSGTQPLAGKRTLLWIKKGARKLIFEVGSEITDFKTYSVNFAGSTDKRFISPIHPAFAYPEVQGSLVFVPFKLILGELGLPYEYKSEGFTVTLTRKK